MAGHAQLEFVMTECSKTQIRLTGPIFLYIRVQRKGMWVYLVSQYWTGKQPIGIQVTARGRKIKIGQGDLFSKNSFPGFSENPSHVFDFDNPQLLIKTVFF